MGAHPGYSPTMHLLPDILEKASELAAVRRDLHAHPELAFAEERTSEIIARRLERLGIPIIRGLGKTGIVGIVRNGTSSRAVGLRADIDALPMTEVNTFAHASRNPGRMHACGHDGHTTMLLAAAEYLAQHRVFDGTVYLVFQPAEEGLGGARVMIEDGLFERCPMEAIFGIHNWPGLEVGQFAVCDGPTFASANRFQISIRGKGGHAAMPHNAIDPVPVACQMVQAFQTILTRNLHPLDSGVITVAQIHAGEAHNVIPDHCELDGTVRAFRPEVLDQIERRMRQISESICAAFDARCDFNFIRQYPATINHEHETAFVRRVLGGLVGERNVKLFQPTLAAEDFSFFLREKPGCYFVIGNGDGAHRDAGHGLGPCLLHNPSYDFNDALIPLGATMWVRLAEAWLSAPQTAGRNAP